MRLLTTVENEAEAETLGDALYADGVATTIKETRDGKHAVWVQDEDRMDEARAFLNGFDPGAERFEKMAKQARAKRREEAKADERLRVRTEKIRKKIAAHQNMRVGPVTAVLIAISVVVFVFTDFGVNADSRSYFLITSVHQVGNQLARATIPFTLTHEPWRLITPIFLHGGGAGSQAVAMGFVHIGFNMWMLYILGTALERALSWWYLLSLVLVSAAFSNLLQLYIAGPFFGGMSGVVYALFGYIWIRGKYDPGFPYRMPQQVVTFLLFWLVLGFTGFMNMANGAHAGGLIVGAVWGLFASGYLGRKLRR